MGNKEDKTKRVVVADLLRNYLKVLPARTKLDVDELTTIFCLTPRYIDDLLDQSGNSSVRKLGPGQFEIMERSHDGVEGAFDVAPSGEVWSSMKQHEINPNRPGSGTRAWRRKASE